MRNIYKYITGATLMLLVFGGASALSAQPSWLNFWKPIFVPTVHKVIYVHGMKFEDFTKECQGEPTCKGAWNQQRSGTNIVHTGWDGRMDPGVVKSGRGAYQLLLNLSKHCRRDQNKSCQIVCGSMGCYATGMAIARWNTTQRYRITSVIALASGEGGSEIGNIAERLVAFIAGKLRISSTTLKRALTNSSFTITRAVQPSRARAAYDHNRNNGVSFYHKTTYVPVVGLHIKGRDDLIVGHSSSCGYRAIDRFTKCGGETIKRLYVSCPSWPKWLSRRCKAALYTTHKPWEGHYKSPSVSSGGNKGKVHGWFSKSGGAYHKNR